MTDLPVWLQPLLAAATGVDALDLSRFVPPDGAGRRSAVLILFGDGDAGPDVLIIERAHDMRSHAGQPAFPGGAVDPEDEGPVAAALREAAEETALDTTAVRTRRTFVDDHGGWSYTTVYADTPAPLATEPNRESVALAWVPVAEVPSLPLHPGFGHTWSAVRAEPVTLVVDAANVVGSRPDGWWRDRVGAAARLLTGLDALRAVTVTDPTGATRVVARVVVVVEGAAAAVDDAGWSRVVRAAGSGDDALVAAVAELAAAPDDGADPLVVTADRELRRRVHAVAPAAQLAGPGWLRSLLPPPR